MSTNYKQINQLLADVYSDKKDRAIMDDFLEVAKNGQLDFYDIEVWKIPTRYIDALIYHGLFLDEMAESNHKCLHKALIEQDAKSEYYEKWNDPYDDSIRTTFARKGYFIEQYLNDTSKYVRMTALKHSPEYLPYFFRDHELFDQIYDFYMTQSNVNLNEFELFLKINAKKIDKNEITSDIKIKDIVNIKRQSYQTPTTIEKTMSPYQLYASNSPLWAVKLCSFEIENFLGLEKKTGKLSEEMFKQTHETNQTYIIDTEVFRITATLPQPKTVSLETLDEFCKNGFTVQFVFPVLDAEEILDNDDRLMVQMITVNYEPID